MCVYPKGAIGIEVVGRKVKKEAIEHYNFEGKYIRTIVPCWIMLHATYTLQLFPIASCALPAAAPWNSEGRKFCSEPDRLKRMCVPF